MVVLAGYKDKMARLMRMDPGLDRRFPQRLHLHDYSKEQLAQVCQVKARVSRPRSLRRVCQLVSQPCAGCRDSDERLNRVCWTSSPSTSVISTTERSRSRTQAWR